MEVQKLVVRGIQLGSSGLANSAQLGSARPAPMQHRQGSLSNLFRDYSRLPFNGTPDVSCPHTKMSDSFSDTQLLVLGYIFFKLPKNKL